MMTRTAKVFIALVIIGVVVSACWRWWGVIAPQSRPASATKAMVDVTSKLLLGTNAAREVTASTIPPVTGVSDYDKTEKNGKLVVQFPINVWPGWAGIIMANGGMDANDNSVFYKKYGFYVNLSIVDDPVKARDLFAAGHSHVLWGTLDMIALFAPALSDDSRTVPVVPQQIDFSDGGDGVVARGDIKSINDFRMKNGQKRTVVLAENSPSHFFFMSLLEDANIDPSEINFRWAADAPSAAKLFVQDKTFDAFVGWSPDIYTVSENVPNTKLVVSSESANKRIADVWAVRNDFYKDHPDVVANLVRGIFEGVEMVRKDPKLAAQLMSKAYNIPSEDCIAMIGEDGGVSTGDAHLTNYRENYNFFIDPLNPANFDAIWRRASDIYVKLGAIDKAVAPGKVKASKLITDLAGEYKDSTDLSQPTFNPNAIYKALEAADNQILSKSVTIMFKPNSSALDETYDTNLVSTLKQIADMAGGFGNALFVIEGNCDASLKGTVPADAVRGFSYDRADSVKKALMAKFKFDPNKFTVKGNGWDNPVPGCTNPQDPECNKKNRRVEIRVLPLEITE